MNRAGVSIAVASLAILSVVAQPAAALELNGHLDDANATLRIDVAAQKVPVANPANVDVTKATMRDLWIGHIFWVRNVVVAKLAGDTAAEKAAEKQAVANAQSIATAIEPFYGAPAKDKLFNLLAGHYGAVKTYLEASVQKNAKEQSEATTKLTSNAEEIAAFLSGANPYLPKDTLFGLLQAHAGHHISQIQQLQAKNYDAEAKTWADMSQHMYVIADALAGAIVKQFPASF